MDKVLSTRVDERTVFLLGDLAWKLKKTKKRIIEEAVEAYSKQVDVEVDVIGETCGAWEREDSAADTAKQARRAFRESFERRHADLR